MKTHTKFLIRAAVPWVLNGALAACFLGAIEKEPVDAYEYFQPSCCVLVSGCAPVSCGWNKKVQEWVTITPVQDLACGAGNNSNSICGQGQGTQTCGNWVGYTDSKCTIPSTLSGTAKVPSCADNCSQTA